MNKLPTSICEMIELWKYNIELLVTRNCGTTRYEGFESFNNKRKSKQISYFIK